MKLPAHERYQYFVDQVVACGEVWSLANAEGWVAFSSEGEPCLPVWPHPDYAEFWATDDWSDCEPKLIELDTWLQRWIPGMEADGTQIVVFPGETEEGVIVTPAELEASLLEE